MPKDLKREIETHLATFPERHQDVLEMKKEWTEFKSRAMWLLVGFIGSVLAIGVWVGTIQSTMSDINNDHSKLDERYRFIEQRLTSLEVNNSEVRARLGAIEATLLEIKTAIIKLQ